MRDADLVRLRAVERIEVLCDADSFQADARADGAAVLAGCGCVEGRRVRVFALDPMLAQGAIGAAEAAAIAALTEAAVRFATPVIGLLETAGTRGRDGVAGLAALSTVQRVLARAAGRVPRVAVVCGPCDGAAAALAALADLRFMAAPRGRLLLSDGRLAAAVADEIAGDEALGGAGLHGSVTGLADGVFSDEVTALLEMRRCLGFLRSAPLLPTGDPPARATPALATWGGDESAADRDIDEVIAAVVDEGAFFPLQPAFACNLVCGFARIAGRAIGILANQPAVLAGALDGDALRKAARFVRLCDGFGLPLVTLVDTPGFLPGTAEARGGIVAALADLVAACASAGVPRVTVTVGRGIGGAGAAMMSRALGADRALAWHGAAIALRGGGPAGVAEAVACGAIDAVIAPADTRAQIGAALAMLG
jgi:propionyl-CoA carboxylase beta chain